jgi:hypothetical protein
MDVLRLFNAPPLTRAIPNPIRFGPRLCGGALGRCYEAPLTLRQSGSSHS